MNPQLETIMKKIVANMDDSEIERISRILPRGSYSLSIEKGEREKPRRKRKQKPQVPEFEFDNLQRIASARHWSGSRESYATKTTSARRPCWVLPFFVCLENSNRAT